MILVHAWLIHLENRRIRPAMTSMKQVGRPQKHPVNLQEGRKERISFSHTYVVAQWIINYNIANQQWPNITLPDEVPDESVFDLSNLLEDFLEFLADARIDPDIPVGVKNLA